MRQRQPNFCRTGESEVHPKCSQLWGRTTVGKGPGRTHRALSLNCADTLGDRPYTSSNASQHSPCLEISRVGVRKASGKAYRTTLLFRAAQRETKAQGAAKDLCRAMCN